MSAGLQDMLDRSPLASQALRLDRLAAERLKPEVHGDMPRWQAAIDALPRLTPESRNYRSAAVTAHSGVDPAHRKLLRRHLLELCPWRKGPFELHGLTIDSEWRSDLKWARVAPALDLTGARVLDVGCGNGYYGWRMLGAGAERVIGIDPTPLYVMQHRAVSRLLGDGRNCVLPLGIEDLEPSDPGFDAVFSMGVLYHRRNPIEHLDQLRSQLRPGGRLVLETLVIDGDVDHLLFPPGRYARMRNVWFIPSVPLLQRWLERCRFDDIRLVDVTATTTEEQRSTSWMPFQSLADFLDPDDPSRTIEGHPGPKRAILVARKVEGR